MGKYSTPVAFAGKEKTKQQEQEKKSYAPIDWSKLPWSKVDVVSAIHEHTSTTLVPANGSGKQWHGACPFPDCDRDTDGFMVWPGLSSREQHFYCRGCKRTGDVLKLFELLHGWSFLEAKKAIGAMDGNEGTHSVSRKEDDGASKFFAEQLLLLRHLYPEARQILTKLERPQVYLQSRGIDPAQAIPFGLAYIPFESEAGKKYDSLVRKWQGRIIFPLTSPGSDDITFAGRTLYGWKRGMTPGEHKEWLEEYNKPFKQNDPRYVARVLKTSPCGHFGYQQAISNRRSDLIIPEGEFDALSLLLSGIEGVIAMGTGFSANLIPIEVESVILAMDADTAGKRAASTLAFDLERNGLDTCVVAPSSGKDWNDMYVISGPEAIYSRFADKCSHPACSLTLDDSERNIDLVFEYDVDGKLWCGKHYKCQPTVIDEMMGTMPEQPDLRRISDVNIINVVDPVETVNNVNSSQEQPTPKVQADPSRILTHEEIHLMVQDTFGAPLTLSEIVSSSEAQAMKARVESAMSAGDTIYDGKGRESYWSAIRRENAARRARYPGWRDFKPDPSVYNHLPTPENIVPSGIVRDAEGNVISVELPPLAAAASLKAMQALEVMSA